ncbi:Asp-tRNA(Asn)/Glu-tRNA(Gln) amidotransferase subunit GatB [soil metagenome]
MEWETVIGLEVHIQLRTQSKLFSGASTAYGATPNSQACGIDLGLPGVLPVMNQTALQMAIKFGLSVNATICKHSVFERKNYFYPDLPKGYQISQFQHPIVQGGQLDIVLEDGGSKCINLTRAHLEEDAGKSLHEDFNGMTGIDLNRAGTPLLEIVSEPELRNAKEAIAYLKTLHTLVTYLEICDGNMQEGSFRCDANVSVRPLGEQRLGTRTELKNINSFRFVERAINYEVQRQIALLESGGQVKQETRLYDPDKDETRLMRSKEEATDYRYFPDPDLLPLIVDDSYIKGVHSTLPELPQQKLARFKEQYQLSDYDARLLSSQRDLADYFETVVKLSQAPAKLTANWIMGDFSAALNKYNLTVNHAPVTAPQLAQLLQRIVDNTISGKIAKTVFEAMWNKEGDADAIIQKQGLQQVSDSTELEKIIETVLQTNPTQLEQYRSGKDKLFGFFIGQVMKASGGKANPEQLNELLKTKLNGN